MHADVFGFINSGQACGASSGHQIPRHLGLAVGGHNFAASQAMHINAVALAAEHQIDAVVDDALAADPSAHARFMQHVHRGLLQNTSADAAQHIIRALALDDDGVNACFVKQLTEQQPRRARANDGDLGAFLMGVMVSPFNSFSAENRRSASFEPA